MCVHLHTHAHTHIPARMHLHTHMHTHTQTHVHTHIHTHTNKHSSTMHAHTHTHTTCKSELYAYKYTDMLTYTHNIWKQTYRLTICTIASFIARIHAHTRAHTQAHRVHLADTYTHSNTPFYALTHSRTNMHAVHLSGKIGTHKLELRILTHDRCVVHTSTCCSVSQCVAVRCRVLQYVASVLPVCCQRVRYAAHSMNEPCCTYINEASQIKLLQGVAVYYRSNTDILAHSLVYSVDKSTNVVNPSAFQSLHLQARIFLQCVTGCCMYAHAHMHTHK